MPPFETFIIDLASGGRRAQFLCNAGTVALHEEEVRGQSAFGRIGIMSASLLSLLVANFRVHTGTGETAQQTIFKKGAGNAACDAGVNASRARVQDGVGVVDVGARQVGDGRLELRETDDHLGGGVSGGWAGDVAVVRKIK